jgi:hypothetical protein
LAASRVWAVRYRGIAAIVSDLTHRGDGDLALEEALCNAEQARAMVLAHYRVLQTLLDNHTVVPLRFGTVFADKTSLTATLNRHHDTLCESLNRVEGALEWGVKMFCNRAAAAARIEEESEAAGATRRQLGQLSEGAGFFVRKRLERVIDAEVEGAVHRCLQASHDHLADVAREATAADLQMPAIHGRPDEMVFNGAYLVERGGEESLFAAIDALSEAYAPYGFLYERTGPWPPYSFSNGQVGAVSDGCSGGR